MGRIITGIFFSVFAAAMYIVYYLIYKYERDFREHAVYTKGMAVGSPVRMDGGWSQSARDILFIDSDGKEVIISSQYYHEIRPIPFREWVDVAYDVKIYFGRKLYGLRIVDERYVKKEKVRADAVFLTLALLFTLVAIILFVSVFIFK